MSNARRPLALAGYHAGSSNSDGPAPRDTPHIGSLQHVSRRWHTSGRVDGKGAAHTRYLIVHLRQRDLDPELPMQTLPRVSGDTDSPRVARGKNNVAI